MSNERPDEFLSWRGRLSSPDALPGQGLDDRELTWERLAERLSGKSRRSLTPWWIAAACLLMASFPVTHLFRDRRSPAAASHLARHAAERQPVPRSSPGSAISTALRSPTRSSNSTAVLSSTRSSVPSSFRRQAPASAGNNALASRALPETAEALPNPSAEVLPNPVPEALPKPLPEATAATSLVPDGARIAADPAAAGRTGGGDPTRHPLRIVCLNEISQTTGRPAAAGAKEPAFVTFGAAGSVEWAMGNNNTPVLTIGIRNPPNH